MTCARPLVVIVLATALFAAADPVRADDVDLDLKQLAKCIDDSGAVLYAAHWCPYCKKQLKVFGKYAKYLPYVECYDGPKKEGMNRTCKRAEVTSFPTWHYPDGRVVTGVQDPEEIAQASGCL